MSALFPAFVAPGDRAAIVVGDARWSFRELAGKVESTWRLLESLGVQPGDRVGIWAERHPLTPVAMIGSALFGAVTVPLNPDLGATELGHILRDAAPRAVLAATGDGLPLTSPRTTPLSGTGNSLGSRPSATLAAALDPSRPLFVLYTSGTTGLPKGAVLTGGNVTSNLDALAKVWSLSPADTITHALPLFHVHGLVLGLFGALRVGATFEWLPRFDPGTLAAALRAPSAVLYAVPTMYHRLAELLERDADAAKVFADARLLVSGSAGLPVREHGRIERATGRHVIERYGLTETLINCAVPPQHPAAGSVGPPLPGTDVLLVDDARQPLLAHDDATIGEVAVRGPNVFAGYLNRPDATQAALDGGTFYTGDLATRDAAGGFRIVGRLATDLIKTAGFKVGAGEIETCLLEHSQVSEVAVIGEPDDDLGERIVAFVVPRGDAPTAAELAAYVGDRLAKHKRPREVHYVDSLPRNAMGKVRKGALRGPVRAK